MFHQVEAAAPGVGPDGVRMMAHGPTVPGRADDGHLQALRERPGPNLSVYFIREGTQQAIQESGKDVKVFSIIVPAL